MSTVKIEIEIPAELHTTIEKSAKLNHITVDEQIVNSLTFCYTKLSQGAGGGYMRQLLAQSAKMGGRHHAET